MKKFVLALTIFIGILTITQAQIVLQEDFEAVGIPADWTQITNASDSGWKVGTFGELSSQYWTIASNGSLQVAATNDDACNCDKSQDYLITPVLDFTGLTGASLTFDMFFGKGTYGVFTEQATIEVSIDGIIWVAIEDLAGHPGWHTHQVDLSDYVGEDSVRIAFHYNDHGGFLYGFAIDNVNISVPPDSDAGLTGLKFLPYGEESIPVPISGTIVNNGLSPITTMEVSYAINGGSKSLTHFHGIVIQPFQTYTFHLSTPWEPQTSGMHEVSVEIESVNGKADEDPSNNVMTFVTEIFPHVVTANRIDEFLSTDPVFTTIATSSEGLDKPTDLDYFPILAKNQLWVVNERVENSGGSTTTIYDAGTPDQVILNRTDGNAWHFMALPTGLAFSNNFNFATSTGIKDANHGNGTFTGPSLWSSDSLIYAQPSGGNGSHLDMQHASPHCMGIASEVDNVFWVTDGYNGSVVRYDFQQDHGPGNDDHSDGIVRRYTEIAFKKDDVIPSHLVLDESKKWLYVVDNGNDRVVRLDINTGSVVTSLPLINEPLAEHSEMGGVSWEVILDSLVRPSGIEIIDNRLLVGDYSTGDIIIYDIDNDFAELGRIATEQEGLTGIKIAPDGSIWYTNRLENTVVRVEPGEVSSIDENTWIEEIHIDPNPTTGIIFIEMPEFDFEEEIKLQLTDINGKKLVSLDRVSNHHALDLTSMPDGIYMLSLWSKAFHTTRKIVLSK